MYRGLESEVILMYRGQKSEVIYGGLTIHPIISDVRSPRATNQNICGALLKQHIARRGVRPREVLLVRWLHVHAVRVGPRSVRTARLGVFFFLLHPEEVVHLDLALVRTQTSCGQRNGRLVDICFEAIVPILWCYKGCIS